MPLVSGPRRRPANQANQSRRQNAGFVGSRRQKLSARNVGSGRVGLRFEAFRCRRFDTRYNARLRAGGVYLDPSLAVRVVGDLVRKPQSGVVRLDGVGGDLSKREAEVLRRIAQGYSNKEIAAQLSLSVKTVETYKARSMEKLSLDSRVDIVRYALQQGWLSEGSSSNGVPKSE